MTTHIKTKIYEIRRSSKGSSYSVAFYFDKEKAIEGCQQYENIYKNAAHKTNFRVYEWQTIDSICYQTTE